jgi:hypothetical protein
MHLIKDIYVYTKEGEKEWLDKFLMELSKVHEKDIKLDKNFDGYENQSYPTWLQK